MCPVGLNITVAEPLDAANWPIESVTVPPWMQSCVALVPTVSSVIYTLNADVGGGLSDPLISVPNPPPKAYV